MAQAKFKIIISDLHLSAGRFFEGKLNPHEDFYFDDELVDLMRFFSTGEYANGPDGPVEVELFINGDYLDFLNVPYQGEFEELIDEKIALFKVEAIIAGHTKVMKAMRNFASLPGKTITYMVGNHDADLFFPKVRDRLLQEWDPQGRTESDKVFIIADRDRVHWEGGVEVHHGHQHETVNALDFKQPFLHYGDTPVLNIPWGSYYVLKIVNRLKTEREYLDKVRPVRVYILFSLFTDPIFILKYLMYSAFYFLKTRLSLNSPGGEKSRLAKTVKLLKAETRFFLDLEREARELLDQRQDVKTIIFGHTHLPMNKIYPDGKQYINTGTWTKMINLDWRTLGQRYCLTFAFVKIQDGAAQSELRHWVGETGPHRVYYA